MYVVVLELYALVALWKFQLFFIYSVHHFGIKLANARSAYLIWLLKKNSRIKEYTNYWFLIQRFIDVYYSIFGNCNSSPFVWKNF